MKNEVAVQEIDVKKIELDLEEQFDASQLPAEQMEQAKELAQAIDVEDSQYVLQYGVGIQSQISQFADKVLGKVSAKDSGYVGEILTELMLDVKQLDVNSLNEKESFLAKMPIIGDMVNSTKKFTAQYTKLSVEVERIVNELDKAKMNMLKDITMLDGLFEKNLDYLRDLNVYIAAADMKLQQLHEVDIPKARDLAIQSNDPVDTQRLNDLIELTNRFEKKAHDLKLSKMITIQTAPQIRLIQNNDQVLVEKIQSSILNAIPLWKNQIVLSITMLRQQKALAVQKKVTDTTNDLLKKNAALLKQNTVGAAREMERGIVDIETLRQVNDDLLTTIEETIQIQKEGRVKRIESEKELLQLEQGLKEKLLTLRNE